MNILSHGTSIVLLILFAVYLYFQLKTRPRLSVEIPHNGGDPNPGNGNNSEEEAQTVLGKWRDGCALVGAIRAGSYPRGSFRRGRSAIS